MRTDALALPCLMRLIGYRIQVNEEGVQARPEAVAEKNGGETHVLTFRPGRWMPRD